MPDSLEPEWISMLDRKPAPGQYIVGYQPIDEDCGVYYVGHYTDVSYYGPTDGQWDFVEEAALGKPGRKNWVSHWVPLPSGPPDIEWESLSDEEWDDGQREPNGV